MSLRFFSDHCVPAKVAHVLHQRGHDVVVLRHVLHPHSPDDLVIAKAAGASALRGIWNAWNASNDS